MPTTMNLIAKAAEIGSMRSWSLKMGMDENTLFQAKNRGTLSPTVAYVLAEEIGESEPEYWALIAAAETERNSACKDRMLSRLANWRKR